jgi:hypothetical protein
VTEPPSALDVARRIADALEAADVRHALGGALALGIHLGSRLPLDVASGGGEVEVVVDLESLDATFQALERTGVPVERDAARRSIAACGDFQTKLVGVKITVFVPSVPLSAAAERRLARAELAGRPAWVLSPVGLAIFKLVLFRPKDRADVERLVTARRGSMDLDFVRGWLVGLVGAEDARILAWDRIVEAARPEAPPSPPAEGSASAFPA